jgi:phosphatidylethanolamine-binding protein (PEBP) family uncharacterized protein
MLYELLTTVALAGVAATFTPTGFKPASKHNLTVAFGNKLAVNGVNIPKAGTYLRSRPMPSFTDKTPVTASAPTIGTSEKLSGTYAIMMVDPDIPPQTAGGATSELLHWMQTGLVSSNKSTTIGGMKVFELINPSNTTPIASYIQPSPPNKSPTTHRYTQLLLNTTGNSSALSTLAKFGKTRTNFSAVNVVKSAGLKVMKGNSFNVTAATNTTAAGGNSATNSTTSASRTKTKSATGTKTTSIASTKATSTTKGSGNSTNSTATSSSATVKSTNAADNLKRDGVMVAGLSAFAAMIVLL